MNGGNHILWGNRCACHLKLKKYDAAVFDASAALQIDKTWLKARTRLGQAFMGLERFEDAAVTLWEVVQKSEDGEAKERVTSMFQKCIRRAKQQAACTLFRIFTKYYTFRTNTSHNGEHIIATYSEANDFRNGQSYFNRMCSVDLSKYA